MAIGIQVFNNLGFTSTEILMLEDAYTSVCSANQWEWLRQNTIESFMFDNYPELKQINEHMKFKDHSGFSYSWTMRHIEYLAKYGTLGYRVQFDRSSDMNIVEEEEDEQQEKEKERNCYCQHK